MTLAAVEPKAHFVQVGLQMFCANPMPSPDDTALQKRESGLDCIRVDVATHVLFGTVINAVMVLILFLIERGRVNRRFVGDDDFYIFTQVGPNDDASSFGSGIGSMNKAEFAIALADTKHYLFVVEFSSVSLMVTADVGLIDLNRAVQHRAIRLEHGSADAMAEIPCCLVADSKFPLHLICGVPLAGFAHQKSSNEPFRQGQVRVIKDRTSGHRELIITVFAVEQFFAVASSATGP